jgi:hypothetical protein
MLEEMAKVTYDVCPFIKRRVKYRGEMITVYSTPDYDYSEETYLKKWGSMYDKYY